MNKILFFTLVLITNIVYGAPIEKSLAWDASPSTGVTGYKIYISPTTSFTGIAPIDAGNVLTTKVMLDDTIPRYIIATAYNATTESGPSNMIRYPAETPPPPPPPGTYNCPCSGFLDTNTPDGTYTDGQVITVGVKFSSLIDGKLTHIKYYKGSQNTGVHVGKVWSSTGQLLATVTFTGETASGWQKQALPTPLTITKNTQYTVSVYNASKYYSDTVNYYTSETTKEALVFPVGAGVYTYSDAYPTESWNDSSYFVDFIFTTATTQKVNTPSGFKVLTIK
jgi:hypothetical protein